MRLLRLRSHALATCLALLTAVTARAEPIAARHWEGVAHGFVSLHTLEGERLADGDLVEITTPTSSGNRVSTRLTLRFKDGSFHQESTVYLQRKTFRLVRNHVVQKGPAFKRQIESTISSDGRVTVRSTDENGKEESFDEHLDLPPDVANGMIMSMLKNISPSAPKTTVSLVAITPKPRLVQLEISPHGKDPFSTGSISREATHYVIKVHVPGVTGAVASVLGKIPSDSHVWMLTEDAPAFVKAELALASDGPTWRLEMATPAWPRASLDKARREPEPRGRDR